MFGSRAAFFGSRPLPNSSSLPIMEIPPDESSWQAVGVEIQLFGPEIPIFGALKDSFRCLFDLSLSNLATIHLWGSRGWSVWENQVRNPGAGAPFRAHGGPLDSYICFPRYQACHPSAQGPMRHICSLNGVLVRAMYTKAFRNYTEFLPRSDKLAGG